MSNLTTSRNSQGLSVAGAGLGQWLHMKLQSTDRVTHGNLHSLPAVIWSDLAALW